MKISIVVPCFNVVRYLPMCLDSIFSNNCENVEVILIDDGSTDDMGRRLNQYFLNSNCQKNITFNYKNAKVKIIHQCNSGVSSARNTGIIMSSGDYIIFIDPDDIVSSEYFIEIKEFIEQCGNPDIVITGFHKIVEDNNGEIISEKEYLPNNLYKTSSVEETIHTIFPKYIGYSIDDILDWTRNGGNLAARLEWGAVWRNIYSKKFLDSNKIIFDTSIHLNEDSMFNALCFSKAKHVETLNKGYYSYTIRPTGALMKNRSAELVNNKFALLNERSNIIENVKQRGYDFSIKDFAGSNIMSCFELIIKMPFKAKKKTCEYIRDNRVNASIKQMPYTGKKKVDIPLFALKHNLEVPMIYAVAIGKRIGFKFNL